MESILSVLLFYPEDEAAKKALNQYQTHLGEPRPGLGPREVIPHPRSLIGRAWSKPNTQEYTPFLLLYLFYLIFYLFIIICLFYSIACVLYICALTGQKRAWIWRGGTRL